jgi:hypothetical protein
MPLLLCLGLSVRYDFPAFQADTGRSFVTHKLCGDAFVVWDERNPAY